MNGLNTWTVKQSTRKGQKGFFKNNSKNFHLKQKNSEEIVAICTALNNKSIKHNWFNLSVVVAETKTVFEVQILSGKF